MFASWKYLSIDKLKTTYFCWWISIDKHSSQSNIDENVLNNRWCTSTFFDFYKLEIMKVWMKKAMNLKKHAQVECTFNVVIFQPT